MKNKELLIKTINTMFWSWGSEPQNEVLWAGNELLEWIEVEFNVKLNIRFERDDNTNEINFDDVIDIIRNI